MIESRWLKLENPARGWYKSDDWKRGLGFRVIYSDNNIALFLIRGEGTLIDEYATRFGTNIKAISDAEMKAEVDTVMPARTDMCSMCGGTITIPEFDPNIKTSIEGELDDNQKRIT